MDISIFGHDTCAGAGASPTALVRFRRAPDEFSDEHFGLTLAEAKNILAEIQKHVVQRQATEYIQVSRFCRRCGAVLAIREVRTRKIQTLFGVVEIEAPRLARCRCAAAGKAQKGRQKPL